MGNLPNPAAELPPHTDFDLIDGDSFGGARLQSFTFHGAEISVEHDVRPLPDGKCLSPNEELTLALSMVGMEDPEVAQAMFLCPGTIKTHKSRLAEKVLKDKPRPMGLVIATALTGDNPLFVVETPIETAPDLSERNIEIIQLIAQGMRYAEIAERLNIPPSTVKSRIEYLLPKAGLAKMTASVLYAHAAGISLRPETT